MSSPVDVVVVGAGPYGLSISAHLVARGVEHRIFGTPMQAWRAMPRGMFLMTRDFATNIYAPKKGFSFAGYCRARGFSSAEPYQVEFFSTYGLWAQKQLVPHIEDVEVTWLSRPRKQFEIGLASGERFTARRAIVATGLTSFAWLPEVLRRLPRELVTHTSQHQDYGGFKGKDVAVLGAGESAIEAAVMLHEAGANTQLIARSAGATFAAPPSKRRRLRDRFAPPMSALGRGRVAFLLERIPYGLHYFPEATRVQVTKELCGPSGAWWMAPRFEGYVRSMPFTDVVSAVPHGGRLKLRLRDKLSGVERELAVDHLVAGTGYVADLDALPFLDRALAARIRRIEQSPKLSAHFESSVRGLYFVGNAAAYSFGPLLRFVAGAEFAAPTVARHLAKRSRGGARR